MSKGKLRLHRFACQTSFKERLALLSLQWQPPPIAAVAADAVQCYSLESLEVGYSVKTSLTNRKKITSKDF